MGYNMFTLTSFVPDITQSLYINLDVERCSSFHCCITLELFNFSPTQAPNNVYLLNLLLSSYKKNKILDIYLQGLDNKRWLPIFTIPGALSS